MKSVVTIALLALASLAALSVGLRWQMAQGQSIAGSPGGSIVQDTKLNATASVGQAALSRGPVAPAIVSATWLNSAPLSTQDLRGKVVVVEFWTFDCINCRNTIPQVRSWYQMYRDQGLVVIGVHSPEFDYEHDVANLKHAIKDLKITYPVALDNDFKTWNAFHVWAWPTIFIVDKQGAIRFTHVGEGAYAQVDQTIGQLLNE